MSTALRELEDQDDRAFDWPQGHDQNGNVIGDTPQQTPEHMPEQGPAGEEPKTGETVPEQPKEAEKQEPKNKGKELSKYELARQKTEREAKAWKKIEAEKASLKAEQDKIASERSEWQRQREAEQIKANPARNLIAQGVTPEKMEAEAKKFRDNFDEANAQAADLLAQQMREIIKADEQKTTQQTTAEQAFALGPGTPQFDQYASSQKPGAPEFDKCWHAYEQHLAQYDSQSQDPLDREIAGQFANINSDFGQRMVKFFKTTAMGQTLLKHSGGILVAYDIVKRDFKLDRVQSENKKLKTEVERLRGATSIGGGSPSGIGGPNGGKAFRDMTTAEKGVYLRSKIND